MCRRPTIRQAFASTRRRSRSESRFSRGQPPDSPPSSGVPLMLWLGAIVLGVAFGLLTGGRLTNLGKVRFRWPWVVLGVILVRFLVLATPLNAVEGAQYLYVLALAAVVAWTAWHLKRVRGIWLISLGALLHLIVILANSGRMQVAPGLAR